MNSISLANSFFDILINFILMTAGFTFLYITWAFNYASLRFAQSFLKKKEKPKKRKKNAFFSVSERMKARFLAKKYYPTFKSK
jgi:hypothetical protein